MNTMSGYELSRSWFDWCFENPEKISPNHTALYFFCIEHCNRLGWKEKFGLPTTMAKEAIGIRSYNTYIKTLNELVDFGFIKLIEKSKNQYSSNIIALSKFDKALSKAYDKALVKHTTKQRESTGSILKQYNKETNNNISFPESKIDSENQSKTDFDKFNDWIKENTPHILKIKNQINEIQFLKIKEKYNHDQIKEILFALGNYRDAPKKYVSVYFTFLKWAEREFVDNQAATKTRKITIYD